jgi:hypothetical protein
LNSEISHWAVKEKRPSNVYCSTASGRLPRRLLRAEGGERFHPDKPLWLRVRSLWPGAVAHFLFVTALCGPVLLVYGIVLVALLLE